MARHQLTDENWECIENLFPPRAKTGRPPTDRRVAMNGILWILRTGSPWRDLPTEYGSWRTIYGLFNDWNSDGTLDRILTTLRAARIESDQIDEDLWCIDGSIVRAHRCAAGGGKKTIRTSQPIMH